MSNLKDIKKRVCTVFAAFLVAAVCLGGFSITSTSGAEEKDIPAMIEEIVVLVNEARTEAGLKPVYMAPYLCDVAQVRARETIFVFDHYRPNGDLFITAVDDTLVPYRAAAENIAAGSDNAKDTFEQWKNSPGHWKNIMNPNYTHIGVGIGYEPNTSEYVWYWEQIFVTTTKELDGQYIPERYKKVPASSGDINGDAVLDPFDLITITKYLGTEDAYLNDLQIKSADMLQDGVITSADAMVLRKYLLGDYDTLPITMEELLTKKSGK